MNEIKMSSNKLRQLFKGHKISEPNFGDRVKCKIYKTKNLNRSVDKNIKKKSKRVSGIDAKSYKGTPKK